MAILLNLVRDTYYGLNARIPMEPLTWIDSFSLVIETTVETREVKD